MISVIIPAYNASKTIKKAIKSVLTQTYTDFELIIVDDGSTDNTLALCLNIAQKNEKITLIHQDNKGLVKARIEGIRHAKGEYVFFLDADDWVSTRAIESLINASENETADVVVAHGYNVARRIHFIKWKFRCFFQDAGFYNESELKPYNKIYIPQLYTNNICGRLLHRHLFKDLLQPNFSPCNIHYGEDRYFNFLISPQIRSVSLLDKHLYFYRHGGSVSGFNSRLWSDYLLLFNFQADYASRHNPAYIQFLMEQQKRVFCQHITNMLLANIPYNEIRLFIRQNTQCDERTEQEILTQLKNNITLKMKLKRWILQFI